MRSTTARTGVRYVTNTVSMAARQDGYRAAAAVAGGSAGRWAGRGSGDVRLGPPDYALNPGKSYAFRRAGDASDRLFSC